MNTISSYNTISYGLTYNYSETSKEGTNELTTETNYSEVSVIYEPSKKVSENKAKEIKTLNDETKENMVRILWETVMKTAYKQGKGLRGIIDKLLKGEKVEGIDVEITPEMIEQAKIDVAPGGYWSADAVSTRLVDFAKAVSSADPSKGEMLKDAIIKGFKMAKEAWGGELPSICNETYELTMKKMDEWMKENNVAA